MEPANVPMQLRDDRVVLTRVGPDAAEALVPAFNGDEQFNLWSGTPTMTLDAVRADLLETASMPGGTSWQITDSVGTLIGVAETALIPPPHGAWIALLIIRQEAQRQGYGSAVAALLEAHLFAQLEVTRIGMGVLTANAPALAFWEKRGYQRGLTRRDNHGNEVITLRLDRVQMGDPEHVVRVRQQFGATAAGYATSVGHAKGDELVRVAELAADHTPAGRALDIATGAGHTAFALSPFVAEVIASDVTPEMLAQVAAGASTRGLTNVTTAIADAHALPWPDGTFAIVTSRIAPHHFHALPLAIREMARVTMPGGLVIVVDSVVPEDPALDTFLNTVERLRDPTHVQSRTETAWRHLFADSDLATFAVERFPHRHPYADWVARALVPTDLQPKLEAAFLNASDAAKAAFQIEIADGRVIAYTDEKLLIAGHKG
jgi:SAM-dependent methyltransferase